MRLRVDLMIEDLAAGELQNILAQRVYFFIIIAPLGRSEESLSKRFAALKVAVAGIFNFRQRLKLSLSGFFIFVFSLFKLIQGPKKHGLLDSIFEFISKIVKGIQQHGR